MNFKKLLVIAIIATFVIGVFVSYNLIFTEKAEAFFYFVGENMDLIICCQIYALRDCPDHLRTLCFTDCYDYGYCQDQN